MLNKKLEFTKTEKKITKQYTKIYKFIFQYSIFVIILISALLLLNQQINRTDTLDITTDFVIEKAKLIGEFNKITNQQANNPDINIHILQGTLNLTDNFMFSTNNLLSHKNLILPKNIFIQELSQTKGKQDFESSNYDIQDIENFAKNIVFTNSDQIDKDNRTIISLPLKDTIENTFYLSCIHNPKILNITCDYYIDNFLDTFFIYDIQRDYKGLQEIFNTLQNTKHKDNLCEGMKRYVLYSNDTNEALENMFISCGDNYYQDFYTVQLFIDIQEQLKKGYINPTVYQNKLLNNYKLISYQQLIYNDIHDNNVNNIRFEAYIYYIQEILKNPHKIDSFYLDFTYWFNNNYLTNLLNKLKYQVSDKNKIEIENIITNFNKINNGDNLIGYAGLKTQLINKDLEKNTNLDIDLDITVEQQNIINKLLDTIKSLSFFKIIREKISGDKIKINGYFSMKDNEGAIPLYVSVIVKNIDDKLIIDTLNFSEYKDLNDTLGEIIKNKDYTIPKLYQYLQENIDIFLSDDNISTCELIGNTVKNLLEGDKNLNELTLLECNPEKITVIKHEEIDKKLIKTYYKITLENFNITDIMISNKYIENEISKSLNNINTNNITIAKMIGEIISYKIEEKEYIQQGSNNIIITIEDFEKFLGTIPDDMVEGTNQIIVEFEIQGIKFIGNYNITSKKIGPLYFQQNDNQTEDENKTDLIIKNFELYLTKENQNQINEFIIDPLKYIKKIDPASIAEYLE